MRADEMTRKSVGQGGRGGVYLISDRRRPPSNDCWHHATSHHSNTTVYYGIHKRSDCIPVDSGVTNIIHDRRSCVDFTLEVDANVARCVHSSVNKPGVKRNS